MLALSANVNMNYIKPKRVGMNHVFVLFLFFVFIVQSARSVTEPWHPRL